MYKKWVLIVIVIISILIISALPLFARLCIENVETNELLRTYALSDGDIFYMEFMHSVNRTLVREYYQLEKDQLMLTRAEYSSFGAGMPEVPEQEGATLRTVDGILHLDGIHTLLPEFIYRVGIIANHTLYINEQVIPLDTIVPPQTALRFKYRSVSAYTLLRRSDQIER